MAESFQYSIDLAKLNGERQEVVACVLAATSKAEEVDNTVYFNCQKGSLAYLQTMLEGLQILIQESGK